MSRRLLAATLASVPLALLATGAAFGSGGAFTDNQANSPQVANSQVNTGVKFPTNKQNEPTIARDPATGRFIAGANDEQAQPPCGPGPVRGATAKPNDCSFYPNVGTTPVYTSADGVSWKNQGMLPGFTDTDKTATLVSDGDPVLAYGPKYSGGTFSTTDYTAYYASLAGYASGQQNGNQAPELITVSRSDDDGATWADPVVAANGHGNVFNDKEAIWVDKSPDSLFYGRIYVSWTQFRSNTAAPVDLTYSSDGGQTWSNPTQLTAAYNNGSLGGRQGSTVRTGPDGAVYVVREDSDQQGSFQALSVSYDGGVTFSKSIDAGRVTDIADPIAGANFRTDSFASLAVSQQKGSDGSYPLYVAFTTVKDGAGATVVRSASSKALGTWTGGAVSQPSGGYAFFAATDVAPNGRVDVAWQAQTQRSTTVFGTGNATIHSWYTSAPAGGSFSAPIRVDSTRTDDPAASSQNNLQRQFWGDYNTLVSTDLSAFFIYTDARHGTGCAAVDAYQHDLTSTKPVPCTSTTTFGDTDIYVSKVTL